MKWLKHTAIVLGVTLFMMLLLVYALRIGIYRQALAAGDAAAAQYEGGRVEALLTQLSDPEADLATKNHAIWALGQIGDERAVPELDALRTGAPCDHANGVCQREVEKAYRACTGGWDLLFWK